MNESYDTRFLTARRQYIASQFQNLNNMQQEAVLTTEGPLLLLAGAGSGKTTVLINRIANLMKYGSGADSYEIPDTVTEEDVEFLESAANMELSELDRHRADWLCAVRPAAPWSIIAITFTNKAANELKERLSVLLGPEAQDIWAMTFHSACCRILRREIERMGYSRSFTIYDASDSERVMKDVIKDMGLDDKTFPAKVVLGAISKEKDNLTSPQDLLDRAEAANDIRLLHIARAYEKYQTRLRDNNALDFDDIICVTVRLLQEHEEVRKYYQRKFRYVLVDEYQDTNHVQYLLTSLLAGGYENICVVGDDDQSIYRFRGATIENILSFEQQYRGARVIRLEQNYRSTGNILDAANHVIARNQGRKGKTLWTDQGAGQPIRYYQAENQEEEAQYIAKTIHQAYAKGEKLKDFTILYRNNALSNFLQTCFVRNGIPFAVVRGRSFLDSLEIRDMRAYLEVIHNPGDSVRLHRIINNPPRKIGAKSLETVADIAARQGVTEFEIICKADKYAELSRASAALLRFGEMMGKLQEQKDQIPLVELYDQMLEQSGYRLNLEAQGTEEAKGRLENIQELKSNIVDYQKRCEEESVQPTLEGLLEELSLISDVDKYDENADVVTMMTMHSAKGLEFPKVFIVGAEEGLFPSYRSMESEEEMEEERRLCYVAMTRAKRELTITCSRRRMLYGQTMFGKPSRFVDEIPPELVQEVEVRPQRSAGYGQQSGNRQAATAWQRGGTVSWQQGTPQRESKRVTAPSPSFASKPSPVPEFRAGMQVKHKAFGLGIVRETTPMGGDLLLRIEFEKVGEKLMMAKTAGKFMQKV